MSNLEQIILACVFFDEKQDYVSLGELSEKFFSNRALLKKVVAYRKANYPFDVIVAGKHFTHEEAMYLHAGVGDMGHISRYEYYYAELRKEYYEVAIQQQIQEKALDPVTVQEYISLIHNVNITTRPFDFEGDLHDYLGRFEERVTGKFEKYSLNLQGFDETLGYIRPKRFYTIGASPGVGKTNLMLKMMLCLMAQDIPCLFFTAEMDYDSLVERMGAINSGLRLFDILNAHLKPEQISDYTDTLNKHLYGKKSYIYETPKFNLLKIKDIVDKTGVKFVFVDYLQKFSLDAKKNETRASVMSDIANGLKELTMSKNVAVFAGSQLDKNADRQSAKLSDLKESGGIEEASDGVILISEICEDDNFKKLKMHVAKNKYGLRDMFVYVMDRKDCDMKYSFQDTATLKE